MASWANPGNVKKQAASVRATERERGIVSSNRSMGEVFSNPGHHIAIFATLVI